MLATGDFSGALHILRTTNSYGPTALALMRAGDQSEAYLMALKVVAVAVAAVAAAVVEAERRPT